MYQCRFFVISFVCLIAVAYAQPQPPKSKRPIPIFKTPTQGLELPNNATSIRENIVDTFSSATWRCLEMEFHLSESSIPCEESEQYYSLNEDFGKVEEEENEDQPEEEANYEPEAPTPFTRNSRRGKGRKFDETTETVQEPTSTIPSSRNARISTRQKSRQ